MNMIMIYGPTSAGKRTVAHALGKSTGYKVLDNHAVFSALTPLFPFEDPKLNQVRMRLGRKLRLELFEEAAAAGVDFISTMIIQNDDSFDFMRETKDVVERQDGHLLMVQLLPTLETLFKRVQSPTRLREKVTSPDVLRQKFAAQPRRFEKFGDFDHLTIDNSDLSPEQTAARITAYYHLGQHVKP